MISLQDIKIGDSVVINESVRNHGGVQPQEEFIGQIQKVVAIQGECIYLSLSGHYYYLSVHLDYATKQNIYSVIG